MDVPGYPKACAHNGILQSAIYLKKSLEENKILEEAFSRAEVIFYMPFLPRTVKPVLSDHLKIDKTKILMTNGSLMKVESMA